MELTSILGSSGRRSMSGVWLLLSNVHVLPPARAACGELCARALMECRPSAVVRCAVGGRGQWPPA